MGVRPLFVFGGSTGLRGARRDDIWVTVGHDELVTMARGIAERVARTFGLEIFDVQLRRESIGWVLRVILDRREETGGDPADSSCESVSLDDCQRVSRDLSAVLDADFTFDHPYTLEVSSPGLDRPLRDLEDCRRFVGRLTKLVTSEPVDGQRHIAGRIAAVDGDRVVVDTGKRVHRIPWALVARARLDVEF